MVRVASIATSNDNINGVSNVTIFIPLATINSGIGIGTLGIGGACTCNGTLRVVAPSVSHARGSYPCFGHYNNYICHRVSCGTRLHLGRGGICRAVGQVNNISLLPGPVVFSSRVECEGGTRCPLDRGKKINFCTFRSRHVVRYSSYLLRPRVFTGVASTIAIFIHRFGVDVCGRTLRGKLLHRLCVHGKCGAGRVVLAFIVGNSDLPGDSVVVGHLGRVYNSKLGDIRLGVGGGGAGIVLKSRYGALCNDSCVASVLTNMEIQLSTLSFCRIGATVTSVLCGGTTRCTSPGSGGVVSLCYNTKAVKLSVTHSTGSIAKIRVVPRTMGSTIFGTRGGKVAGTGFVYKSTGTTTRTLGGRNAETSIVVISPPQGNYSDRLVGVVASSFYPRGIICVSYSITALSESVGLFRTLKCGLGRCAPTSLFPQATRIRAITLLIG